MADSSTKHLDSLPRLPMLYFDPKPVESVTIDFDTPLRRFIRKNYTDEDPGSHQRSIKELDNLRRDALHAPRTREACDILKRYYAQLHSLRNRFKMAKDESILESLTFQWKDTYSERINVGDITFEMLCILLNIGLLYLELGATDTRATDENMKVCCMYFQCAAYCFDQVNEQSGGLVRSKDMSHDLVAFMQQVSLAQAQECVFEKAVCDSRKPAIVAKLASQVAEYYEMCILIILNDRNNSIEDATSSRDLKSWKKYVEFKTAYFSALSLFFMGWSCMDAEKPNDPKMGEAIAWFSTSQNKLTEASKFVKGLDRPEWITAIGESVKSVSDLINKKVDLAKKENDFIYHQPIPSADKLTAVKGASLVKPIPFSVSDPQVLGRDIFGNLVPIEVHVTSSLYTDRKDNLLREIGRNIEDKNTELESMMSSLNLSTKSLRPSISPISDELIDICAEIHLRKDILESTEEKIRSLDSKGAEINKLLIGIRKMIEEERQEEKEHQKLFGKRPESTLIENLEKDWEKHQKILKETRESDAALKETLSKVLPDLKSIVAHSNSPQDLNKLLPEPGEIPVDDQVIKRLEYLIGKVDEMKKQRFKLENDLRQAVSRDDVLTKVLMTADQQEDKIQDLFDQEIKKFDPQVKLIDQNLSAQEKIIAELVTANADYAPTRRAVMEAEVRRKQRTQEIVNSYETLKRITEKVDKGVSIYKQLTEKVASLETRVKSVCQLQSEERQKHRKKSAPVPPIANPIPSGLQTMNTLSTHLPGLPSPQAVPTSAPLPTPVPSGPPKLKDYLPYMNRASNPLPSTALPPVPNIPSLVPSSASPLGSQQPVYSAIPSTVQVPVSSHASVAPTSSPYSPYVQPGTNPATYSAYPPQTTYSYASNGQQYSAPITTPYSYQQPNPQQQYHPQTQPSQDPYGGAYNYQYHPGSTYPQQQAQVAGQYWHQNGQQQPQPAYPPPARQPTADLLSDDIPEAINQNLSVLSPTPASRTAEHQ